MNAQVFEFPRNEYQVTVQLPDDSIIMATYKAASEKRAGVLAREQYPHAKYVTVTKYGVLV